MKIKVVILVLALIGCIVSGTMFVPALWAGVAGTPDATVLQMCAFGSFLSCAAVAVLARPTKKLEGEKSDIGRREAFAIVTFSWVLASIIGGLPYVLYGTTTNFTDAFFEAMSGFTTTGASILTDIESNPHGILLWRAITHWLGGMGIIVLGLTILTFLGGGGMELFKAESPTPVPEKLTPRLKQTAVILWGIYALLTVCEIIALMLCGTTFYEAVTHTFATVATGGFSIYNDSIAHFHSPLIEWVITFFTFLAGTNFTLHFLFLRDRSLKAYYGDDEFRWYLCFALFLVISISLVGFFQGNLGLSFGDTFRQSAFQTVTILTTTGFGITDTLQWPYYVHFVLLLAMVVGGCAGSTGGGIKVMRAMILTRRTKKEMIRTLLPQRVTCVRIGGRPMEDKVIHEVLVFFVIFMIAWGGIALFLTLLGIDVVSAISGVLACLSNIGPGLGQFGPVSNYAAVPAAGKWALAFAMLAGRLELTTVFVLFMTGAWKR